MKLEDLHVAIVGAGPAGSATAICLRRLGVRVTLLERAEFPRDKVCGDGCTPRTLWMLERLGVTDLPATEAAPVTRFHLASPGGHSLVGVLPPEIFGGRAAVVPRMTLDAAIARVAVESGAELRESTPVTGIERDADGVTVALRGRDPLRVDLVVGADGSPSVVRKALGAPRFPPEHAGVAVRCYYGGLDLPNPDAFTLIWERDLLPAYGWIFPLPGGRANVGLGLRADHLAKSPRKLRELLDDFCESPRVRAELAGGERISPVRGHNLPAGSFAEHLVFDRALLVGDAAGFINPLTGEGIEFALESGELVAETLAEAVQTGDLSANGLAGYAQRCSGRFRRTFRLNHRLQRVFEHPRLVDHLIRAGARSPRVVDDLAQVMLGERPRISLRLAAATLLGV